VTTSSTSASEPRRGRALRSRWPWAGLLALALLLGADRLLFGLPGPWHWLLVDDPNSAAGTRLELRELVASPRARPRVIVVGTSRVIDGFDRALAQERMPEVAFAKLGNPRFEPFALRALVPDLVAAGADAVCLIASEQDTHRPLRLEPVPGSSAASLGALVDLLRVTDWRFAFENRTALYRLAGTSALRLYRFRPEVLFTGLGELRRFSLDERIADVRAKQDPFRPVALWGAAHHAVAPAALRTTFDLFPPRMDPFQARVQAGVVQEITAGPHVAVQKALYRRAVEELRRAGVEVVIVQGTMHPAARDLYDTRLAGDFLTFARELALEHGVRFLSLAELPRFAESDFYDLVHTNRRGAAKITRAMLRGLRATSLLAGAAP
jgi:hypothetical protein